MEVAKFTGEILSFVKENALTTVPKGLLSPNYGSMTGRLPGIEKTLYEQD
jgi:hypothetical protein